MKRFFLKGVFTALLSGTISLASASAADRPNIVLILTDDMGFSDLGCYGGEISTPNIDKLAVSGVKFSQFYNCGKCEPSRAALISGHSYQATKTEAIKGNFPSLGEMAKASGYRTMMVGKWHSYGTPFKRGFDRHFGFMGGGTNSFLGDKTFTLDGKKWPIPEKGFYSTDALSQQAAQFIQEENKAHPDQPFFMYVGYNAPHSSIMAPAEEVAKYRGKYLKGWDVLALERFERQKKLGLAGPGWRFPERPRGIPAWDSLSEKEKDFEDLRMATYAAMIDRVDQGVGRILQTLEKLKLRENTLVMFMNDNGASPNDERRRGDFGTPESNWNVGVGWAHLSNTPFKFYKRTQHSGGVTTPFIASWPAKIQPRAAYDDQPCHFTDMMPTLLDLAGGSYPQEFGGKPMPPLPGRSIVPILKNSTVLPERTLNFSLFNNMAVVDRDWRLVTAYGAPWQLFDLKNDRTETTDLAAANPEKLQSMLALQAAYYEKTQGKLQISPGEKEIQYVPIFDASGKIGPCGKDGADDEAYARGVAEEMAKGKQLSDSELTTIQEKAAKMNAKKAGSEGKDKKKKKKAHEGEDEDIGE